MRIQHEFEFKEIVDSDIEEILIRESDSCDWLESLPVILVDKRTMAGFRIAYFTKHDDPFDCDADELIELKSNCSEGWKLDKEEYLWAALPVIN
jgi:hypothetical protein